jgi:hypothetical protein
MLVNLTLLLLASCAKEDRPAVSYELARDTVDLGSASYSDPSPIGEVSLLNSGGITLVVTPQGYSGEGAEHLLMPTGLDYSSVATEASLTFEVTLDGLPLGWDNGAYAPDLTIEIGSFWDDPSSWGEEPQWETESLVIPITFSLACDVDGDGLEAAECGGDDADDADASVGTEADTGLGGA